MAIDIPLRCTCGTIQGLAQGLDAKTGNRLVCYCGDCQSFAHHLGKASTLLDAHGGSDIVQTTPARVRFEAGQEQIACLQLRPGGLHRWYAACCRTPIANTSPNPQMPFVGLIDEVLDTTTGGHTRDELLGPVRARVQVTSAQGETEGHKAFPLRNGLRFLSMLIRARLRGDHKRSPFFDAANGEPLARPTVLTGDELAAAEASRDGRQDR